MNSLSVSKAGAALLLGCTLLAPGAQAETQAGFYNHLVSTAVVAAPLLAQDTLFVDTFTTERGSLLQTTTFTIGAGVQSFVGNAAWLVTGANEVGPRLTGVNIDLFDSSNNLVQSDTFAGMLGAFAHSTFNGLLGPGTYTLVASGTGVRDSVLDISITTAVPEPATYGMLLAGIGLIGYSIRRRKTAD